MERVEFYWKPRKLALWMLAPVAAVTFGLTTFLDKAANLPSRIVGVVSLCVGGGLLVAYGLQFVRWQPRIVLDDDGLFAPHLGTPRIPWESIVAMKIVPFPYSKLIALRLSDGEERYKRLPWWKKGRGFGYEVFNLSPLATEVSAEVLMAMIVERIEHHSRTSGVPRADLDPTI